jgi:hypothetical protein
MAGIAINDPMFADIIDELKRENTNTPPMSNQHYCVLFRAGEIWWETKVSYREIL